MASKVMEHPIAARLLRGGQAESSHFWEENGVKCKCRPDYLSEDIKCVIDLKTTLNARLEVLRYQQLFMELAGSNSTEKQAMAASLIILVDELADKFVFHTGKTLAVSDIARFLKDKSDVSAGQRAYNFLCDWVAVNANRFRVTDNSGEFWGRIDEENNKVFIISNIFRKALTDNGFDEKAVTSWLRSNRLIVPDKNGKSTKYTSVGGRYARYVIMHLNDHDDQSTEEYGGELL